MSSTMRVFYLYIVSLISLLMFSSGVVYTVYGVSSYIFPTNTVFYENTEKQNNSYYDTDTFVSETNNREVQKRNYKKTTLKNTIISVLIAIIGFILYRYHWNRIETERALFENEKGEM